jgi:hypothetical protein
MEAVGHAATTAADSDRSSRSRLAAWLSRVSRSETRAVWVALGPAMALSGRCSSLSSDTCAASAAHGDRDAY